MLSNRLAAFLPWCAQSFHFGFPAVWPGAARGTGGGGGGGQGRRDWGNFPARLHGPGRVDHAGFFSVSRVARIFFLGTGRCGGPVCVSGGGQTEVKGTRRRGQAGRLGRQVDLLSTVCVTIISCVNVD